MKTITFSFGIHRTPSLSSPSDLDYAVNLMPCNGELKSLPPAEPVNISLDDGDVLLCIHHINNQKHYVVHNAACLAYYDELSEKHVIHTYLHPVDHVTAMGNILIIKAGDGGGYAVWKDNSYHCLDAELPKMQVQFRLRNHYVQTFDKGEETGIRIERTSNVRNYNFSEIVPPTPMTISCTGEYEFYINVNLLPSTVYRLQMSHLEGKGKGGLAVWLIDGNDNEIYGGYGYGKSPYVTFATDAEHSIVRLRCKMSLSDKYHYRFSAVLMKGVDTNEAFLLENTEENFNAVMAVANRFVNQYSRNNNRFIYPFFVRYALRMYDGSLVCPSSPCLMLPNVGTAPQIWMIEPSQSGTCDTYTSANIAELTYRLIDRGQIEQWRGLISGLVIAVSSPIYSFNQGAEWSARSRDMALKALPDDDGNEPVGYGLFDDGDGCFSADWLFRKYNSVDSNEKVFQIQLPQFDSDKIEESLTSKAEFYIVKEIALDELPQVGSWKYVDMEDRTLEGLEARQRLDDNVLSLSQRHGDVTMVYNSRLVVGAVTEHKFKGYPPPLMNGFCSNIRNGVPEGCSVVGMKALVTYVENGMPYTLCANGSLSNSTPLTWFCYPGLQATTAVLWCLLSDGTYQRAELQLRQHRLLNLSYWFNHFEEPLWSEPIEEEELTEDQQAELQMEEGGFSVHTSNKLQQTAVNNPFLFEPKLTNLVGSSVIKAMATTTQALSQGQFGDFPLYVFTGDGIWALGVADDGAFATRQMVSRDVCLNGKSVVMTDNAVVFPTQQGLKMLTGSAISNLSGIMDGPLPDLSVFRNIDNAFNHFLIDEQNSFSHVIANSKMAYDYPSNLLHIYPDDIDAHYVYSFLNGQFAISTDNSQPLSIVNDYPNTVIQTSTALWRFSNQPTDTNIKGVAITRPICFDNAVELKRINDMRVIWKRMTRRSSVKVAVVASNDRMTWWRVKSLNSHSYRWYRIALFADINGYERIEALLLQLSKANQY